jgi:hydroxyacylglutathione hydrolase
MKIEKIVNKIAQENTYLLSNSTSHLIIDPGSDSPALLEHLNMTNKQVSAILLTHAHFDHIMGLNELKQNFPNAPIYLHPAEKEWMKTPELNASLFFLGRAITGPNADCFYRVNHLYDIDSFRFQVLETPGHSVGGISLLFESKNESLVFSGDALFKNAIGRWDLPTGNQAQLLKSIREQLFKLDENTQVFPGHGPNTSIGTEKQNNPFFQ